MARRLFASASADGALPLWADGGAPGGDGGGGYAPGRHLITAHPASVERLRVETLPFRGLTAWLRERLPPRRPGHLTAVLLAYDAGRNLERLPATAREDPRLPDVVLASYPAWLSADGPDGPWVVRGEDPAARARLAACLRDGPPPDRGSPDAPAIPRALISSMDQASHAAALRDVLDGIAAGELYQANVARRLEAPMSPDASPALYERLRAANPAGFGVLWSLGARTWLASSSPECLLTWDPASRQAHSYPIKGTRPRGRDEAEDARLARDLAADPKERAEHLMIVDLVRNDLGRVAVPGGVSVPRLFEVQTLPTVHHLVSDVRATVREDVDLAAILAAVFPGGSVTGAPKIAAMARIERVEGLRRGFYTGSFGLVEPDGAATFSILIRTCVATDGRLLYQTGGGIVADSDPAREWEETRVTARALRRALDASRPGGPVDQSTG